MAGPLHGLPSGGAKVSIGVDPFNIQIMKKPESEDEEAVGVNG